MNKDFQNMNGFGERPSVGGRRVARVPPPLNPAPRGTNCGWAVTIFVVSATFVERRCYYARTHAAQRDNGIIGLQRLRLCAIKLARSLDQISRDR